MKTKKLQFFIASVSLYLFCSISWAQKVPTDLMRNCKQWKITYPDGVEDKVLCGDANNEYFFVNSTNDGVVFKAPVRSTNGTTPNSSYIRSELRERTEDGTADIYWTTTGKHVVYSSQAITHLPLVKPHLVATQIHGNKTLGIDDAMVLRLEGQHLFLSFNGTKLRSNVTIKTDYVLGKKHEVIFEVIDDKHYCYYSEDGKLLTAYNSGDASAYLVKDAGNPILMTKTYGESYFKIGNYTQSNPDTEGSSTDNPNNYGEVVVYDFLVIHGTATTTAVTGISLAPKTTTISKGKTSQLTPTISPSNATNKLVSYKSSNTLVATVSSTGLVTGIKTGTAVITVTSTDGSFTATSNITVEDEILQDINIALNKKVTSSVATEALYPVANLVDGYTTDDSRVSSSGYPQTFTIDLGAAFEMSNSELVFYQDRAYQYTISSSLAANGPFTKVIDRSNNTIPGTVTSPVTDKLTTSGRYLQLTVTGASNYTGTWVSVLDFRVFGTPIITTNISNSNDLDSEITVYPNPFNNLVKVNTNDASSIESIVITDLLGKSIHFSSDVISHNSIEINTENFKSGMYIIVVKSNSGIKSLKIIKQ